MAKDNCPFLGLKEDRESFVSYASYGNMCFRSKPPVTVKLDYQEQHCLSEYFGSCPVYQAQGGLNLAKQHQEPDWAYRRQAVLWFARITGSLFFLMLAFIAFANRDLIAAWFSPEKSKTQGQVTYVAPTFLASTPLDEYKPALFGTPTLAETESPRSAETSTPTTEETSPVGNENGLLVHQLISGESLDLLASKYRTTTEAILSVNYGLKPPLLLGQTIVVPEGLMSVDAYPQFEVKFIAKKTQVAKVAEKYNCDRTLLKKFNVRVIISSGDTDYVLAEKWVLIPRPRKSTSNP